MAVDLRQCRTNRKSLLCAANDRGQSFRAMVGAVRSLKPARVLRRWAPALAVALGGLALSLFAYVIARNADEARLRSAFELRVEWRARDIERRLDAAAQSVQALAVFAAVDPAMNARQFKAFAALQQ